MQDVNESTTVLWWGISCVNLHCCPCVTSFQSSGGVKVVSDNNCLHSTPGGSNDELGIEFVNLIL